MVRGKFFSEAFLKSLSSIKQEVKRNCPIAVYCPTGSYFTTLACAVIYMAKNPQYSLDAVVTFAKNEREFTFVQEDLTQMRALYDSMRTLN
jgi:hypothetical protein